MARRQDHLIRNLLITALIVIAAMHPQAVGQLAHLAAGLLLAIVQGVADAAADQPGPAVLTAGLLYVIHQIRTHQPKPSRARA
ncbi:hypothetical protein OG342_04975 [Streptomyces bobili]|uniref:hypothetical protein n=1 Tax=Streptomyces bobili TaxID=67280 RepID=UPI002254DAA0|nr:hypothetical protein [Streptomyces bobili]MCX5522221.1 hypothetical protein [Streptomyces bobili]